MQNQGKPTLYILRGLPGSGKSTLARSMVNAGMAVDYFEADMWMYNTDGEYAFDPKKLGWAHSECIAEVGNALLSGNSVIVSNTCTTEKEIQPYLDIAAEIGSTVVSIVVENRSGTSNIHGVPEEKLQQMQNRFALKLK